MRILIATDAWHPQVNGVVRTLTSLARSAASARRRDRLPDPRRISFRRRSDLSGPARSRCRTGARSRAGSSRPRRKPSISRPKARSAGRCAPIAAAASSRSRPPTPRAFRNMSRCAPIIPASVGYAVLRHFHAAAVDDHGRDRLAAAGACRSAAFASSASGRAASTPNLFTPDDPAELDLPRPIFMTMGRVAVEKNLEAFLSLDLPGTKVVIGDGPQKAQLRAEISGRRLPRREEGRGSDRRISRRPTSSCSRASPTPSASCSSKRWLAARRSRHFRSPARWTSSPITRSARWTTICAAPACAR